MQAHPATFIAIVVWFLENKLSDEHFRVTCKL
jgi:hypothetical protein